MITIPKIVLIALLIFVAWYAVRWFNRQPTRVARRRPATATSPQPAIEDLVACRICGARFSQRTAYHTATATRTSRTSLGSWIIDVVYETPG